MKPDKCSHLLNSAERARGRAGSPCGGLGRPRVFTASVAHLRAVPPARMGSVGRMEAFR